MVLGGKTTRLIDITGLDNEEYKDKITKTLHECDAEGRVEKANAVLLQPLPLSDDKDPEYFLTRQMTVLISPNQNESFLCNSVRVIVELVKSFGAEIEIVGSDAEACTLGS